MRTPPAIVVLLVALGLAATAAAQSTIDWSSIDGGGHFQSTGGSFQLSGTIGQPDAGVLTGGSYTLHGGFWPGGGSGLLDVAPPGERTGRFHFGAPAPNPVRSQSLLSFELPTSSQARLRVYDVSGRAVRTTDFGRLSAGRHEHAWRTIDDAGRSLPSGVYFLSLESGEYRARKRVLVLH